jgi:hypothetical protein
MDQFVNSDNDGNRSKRSTLKNSKYDEKQLSQAPNHNSLQPLKTSDCTNRCGGGCAQ